MAEYKDAQNEAETGEVSAVARFEDLKAGLSDIRFQCGLTKTALESWLSVMRNRQFSRILSSQQGQKEADRVWKGAESVLFGRGKRLHFKRFTDIDTISGKSATNGVKYFDLRHKGYLSRTELETCRHAGADRDSVWDGMIVWNGHEIRCAIDWTDGYTRKSIGRNKVSYCEIKRVLFTSGWRYYVILYLSGDAPKRFRMGSGTAGIDPGVSTEAVDTGRQAFIEELAPKAAEYNKVIQKLQASIDRERRMANPGNFNTDGTVKPGKHAWVKSKTQARKERAVTVLYRKKSAYTNCSHRNLANRILRSVDTVFTEAMNFSALARKAKKTERSDKASVVTMADGTKKAVFKYRRKKRFGKSVNDRSPALFLRILEQKYQCYGGAMHYVDTRAFRASQYNHADNAFVKVPLSQRIKIVGGVKVLRDLYSAFLLRHSQKNGKRPKRKDCAKDFPLFLKHQAKFVQDAQASGAKRLACFGF